ncbi:MAG: arylesterase [Pseudomonadota bacterium]
MQDRAWSNWRALFSGTIAALALAACSENAEDAAAVPASTAAGIDVDDSLPTIPVMGPQRRIIAFGDSLFAGYGLSPEESYPSKLEAALRVQGVNADIVNAAVSGDTSAAGQQRLAFTLDAQEEKPDLFILELGGNDLLRGLSPEETRANFVAMLDELAAREIPVLLMGMRSPANYGEEYQAQFDAMYADLAREYDAALIPFWLEDIYQDQSLFQSDRIHPTAEGIERLVESTLDEVSEALPEPEVAEAG